MSRISKTSQELRSVEGSTPLRPRPAAAVGFWVLLVAASIGIFVVPGATADRWAASSGPHAANATSAAGTTRGKRPPPRFKKTLNSKNARPVGLSDESNNCTLTRSGLGDTFTLESDSTRCTWTNASFSHMGRREIFVVKLRFDNRPPQRVEWENEINLRPEGDFGNEDCASGGNHEVMLLRLFVARSHSRDVWRLDIRGGTSLNLSDQVVKRLRLGPIVVGKTLTLKFDIIARYLHGAASVWQDGKLIYANRDRPLGFHYDCDRTTDISNFPLRMQHGVYREGGGPATLTSSGFRFLLSRRVR